MTRLKLTVSYVGTGFAGWQAQEFKTRERPRTVQSELEKAAAIIAGCPIRIHGAGRTDSGVHAEAQTAHMDVPQTGRSSNWMRSFAALLPHDLSVMAVEEVPETFHCRFDALGKHYTYALWLSRPAVPPRLRPFVWQTGPLNLPAMEQAAQALLGEHDFVSFRNVGAETESTVRRISAIRCENLCPSHQLWHFEANGFLKQMVRNLMGLLVHVGRGKVLPGSIPGFIAAKSRKALPSPTAPASGLTLTRVLY